MAGENAEWLVIWKTTSHSGWWAKKLISSPLSLSMYVCTVCMYVCIYVSIYVSIYLSIYLSTVYIYTHTQTNNKDIIPTYNTCKLNLFFQSLQTCELVINVILITFYIEKFGS